MRIRGKFEDKLLNEPGLRGYARRASSITQKVHGLKMPHIKDTSFLPRHRKTAYYQLL